MSSNLTSSAIIGFVPNLIWIGTWNWKTYRKKIVYRFLFSTSEPIVHDYQRRSGALTSLRVFESHDYPPLLIITLVMILNMLQLPNCTSCALIHHDDHGTLELNFASLQEVCEVDSWVRYKCPICGAIFDICIGD